MRTPNTRIARLVGLAAAPAAIVIAGALVWTGSNAAFSSVTSSPNMNWSAGTVVLSSDNVGIAAFSSNDIIPGQTGQKCVVVTSKSSVPGIVKAYVKNLALSAQGLENRINFTIEEGAGGSFNDCTGFVPNPAVTPVTQSLKNLAVASKDYSTGVAAWDVAGTTLPAGLSHTYRSTWKFDTTGMTQTEVDALQGSKTNVDLIWELQNK